MNVLITTSMDNKITLHLPYNINHLLAYLEHNWENAYLFRHSMHHFLKENDIKQIINALIKR